MWSLIPTLFASILTIISLFQIVLAAILVFIIPKGLHNVFDESYSVTVGASLVAGLVVLPSSIRVIISSLSPFQKVSRTLGFTLTYQRLLMLAAAWIHKAGLFITCYNYSALDQNLIADKLLEAIQGYIENSAAYSGVDDVQYLLKCCGSQSFKDWLSLEAVNASYNNLLFQPVNEITLPASCCPKGIEDCLPDNVINKEGCASHVYMLIRKLYAVLIGTHLTCLGLEIAVLISFQYCFHYPYGYDSMYELDITQNRRIFS